MCGKQGRSLPAAVGVADGACGCVDGRRHGLTGGALGEVAPVGELRLRGERYAGRESPWRAAWRQRAEAGGRRQSKSLVGRQRAELERRRRGSFPESAA